MLALLLFMSHLVFGHDQLISQHASVQIPFQFEILDSLLSVLGLQAFATFEVGTVLVLFDHCALGGDDTLDS